jgi:threonyl-tRNA synthetase
MSDIQLSTIRHSASHVLAQAVLELFPDAKLGIGPSIDNGFYYDFELSRTLNNDDLSDIEKKMKKIIKQNQPFSQYSLDKPKAVELMKKRNQHLKLELIDDLNLPDYSFYENGPFLDLCKGPHVEKTREIGAVKLLKVAGAYWKGSEKNQMLQRIYGTAFKTKEELKDYLKRLEEAKRRDHRVLGKQLDLFSFDEEMGTGLMTWNPKGAMIRHIIETYWKNEHFKSDYQLLYTPHIGKAELWKTSGHLDFYDENMYASMSVDNQDYFIKPMNCPFHILVYKGSQHSYRELPIRYAELGTVYRYERSGVLHGLLRARGFTQDDAHIICTKEQAHDEIRSVLELCIKILNKFGFESFKFYLSTKPKDKSVGNQKDWDVAESALGDALIELNLPFEVDDGGGAFYGPKIDVKIEDAIGREWQCSTIQFDFNLSERFDMTYIDSEGKKARPYMIHRAIFGSLERFFGILIEHYEGRFPMWLAPVQVRLIGIGDVEDYMADVKNMFLELDIRVEIDKSNEKLGYKIRQGAKQKIPYLIIIGNKEKEDRLLSVRKLGDGDMGSLSFEDFMKHLDNK